MAEPIIVDLDDFTGSLVDIAGLIAIKLRVPDFKVTLFTIPGEISGPRVKKIRDTWDWIDLVPHGLMHRDAHECERWSRSAMRACLATFEGWPFTRGFKAPGWLLSDECFEVLHESGYWVADQIYNRGRRPEGLRVYELDSPNKIHGHLGHRGGYNANELELIRPQIIALADREFGFVKDHITTWRASTS